jgi:hypothetical protein
MKNIDREKLTQLLEIIHPAPALRLAHFSDSGEEMISLLHHFSQEEGYEYQINLTQEDFFHKIAPLYKASSTTTPLHFQLTRPRYMVQGKVYDYLFVTCEISEALQESFIQKVHAIIKNAGLILIFIPKEEKQQRQKWLEYLEKYHFVASNTIDNLCPSYDILISKKMHGWGG